MNESAVVNIKLQTQELKVILETDQPNALWFATENEIYKKNKKIIIT